MINPTRFPLLAKVNSPADLRSLEEEQLAPLTEELREYLIESVATSGGHFGAGLGCVELTVALHYLFDTPEDRIVWDVGHQAYPHKILTGRRDQITTIKQKHGLAPFPRRAESDYDSFGVGHSSTSISAAMGMAVANRLKGDKRRTIAVIGDGAMTAGMAYEALNHGGAIDPDMLVVLNENQMSISPNIGALTKMLSRLVAGSYYTRVRERGKQLMKKDSLLWRFMSRWEEHMKGMVVPSTLFEELGFNYFGPVDGHDLPYLIRSIRTVQELDGPQLIHVITQKGKGYVPAEKNPVRYHAVGPFDPETGEGKQSAPKQAHFTDVFGDWLVDMAQRDKKLVAITPAMKEGSGLTHFAECFPDRYFDVGIAEQHSITLAAGMACEGLRPVVAIYSTFLQRAYDQLIHDVALQDLPVTFAIDRAGLVGPDGPTHAGSFDLSFLRCVPNLTIMAPADENECRQMLYTAHCHNGPAAVRYPRSHGPGVPVEEEMTLLPLGTSQLLQEGADVAILAFGSMVHTCRSVSDTLNATLINMRFVKPLDCEAIKKAARDHRLIVTVEENAVTGGAGSGVNELLAECSISIPILNIGLSDTFIEHATRAESLQDAALDSASIVDRIRLRLAQTVQHPPLRSATDRG